ncbi:MAG TPA: hypothetical protein VIL00_16065 [Pseudonocardiaceae bacterium]
MTATMHEPGPADWPTGPIPVIDEAPTTVLFDTGELNALLAEATDAPAEPKPAVRRHHREQQATCARCAADDHAWGSTEREDVGYARLTRRFCECSECSDCEATQVTVEPTVSFGGQHRE